MNDNIRVTTAETLATAEESYEYVRQTSKAPDSGKYAPTGIAGYVVGECTAVCHECFGNEESDTSDPSPIWGDSESDYPGTSCEDCEKWLDTYVIVYRENNPKLYYRLEQRESLGFGVSSDVPTIEEIGNEAKREAYEVGWDTVGETHEGTHAEGGEFEGEPVEPTRHGSYDTSILPKLRAIAGYGDSGHGTWQNCYYDESAHVLSHDVIEGYQAGYCDRAKGEDYGHSLENTGGSGGDQC